MTIRRIACLTALLALAGGPVEARDSRRSVDQTSVWNAVQARWQAWQDDDFEAYLAAHHETWHRWAPSSDGLEDKADVKGFWQRAKAQEETVAFTLNPAAIETYDSGRLAAVHWGASEQVAQSSWCSEGLPNVLRGEVKAGCLDEPRGAFGGPSERHLFQF